MRDSISHFRLLNNHLQSTDLTLTPSPLLFNNFSYFQSFQNLRPCAKFSKNSIFEKTMADKFYLNFQDNVILGQGYKFKKEENQNCFDFIRQHRCLQLSRLAYLFRLSEKPAMFVDRSWRDLTWIDLKKKLKKIVERVQSYKTCSGGQCSLKHCRKTSTCRVL